ncbi:MAG: hypothetical protein LBT44_02490 [Clostridiales bacterium]|jgi:ribulose 1,5-bisphosphate synthetase/thiazole synthase|nr:hypothetical protein [Clostridiales bacterium]
MISRAIFNDLKQVDVSKNKALTSERVSALWARMQKEQREQIYIQAGIQKNTVDRTRRMGNISVTLACVLAQVMDVDPYYLTAETGVDQGAEEGRILQFLVDHNYQKTLDRHSAIHNGGNPVPKSKPAKVSHDPINAAEISIESFADDKISSLTPEEKSLLEGMSEEEIISLLQSLYLRSKYNDSAKNLVGLLKLLLIG